MTSNQIKIVKRTKELEDIINSDLKGKDQDEIVKILVNEISFNRACMEQLMIRINESPFSLFL